MAHGVRNMSFADRKARILAEIDRSPKGSWDARIVALLNWINDQPGIVTTSSCSGRVALYRSPAEGSQKAGSWLFVSHDPVAVDEVWDAKITFGLQLAVEVCHTGLEPWN